MRFTICVDNNLQTISVYKIIGTSINNKRFCKQFIDFDCALTTDLIDYGTDEPINFALFEICLKHWC